MVSNTYAMIQIIIGCLLNFSPNQPIIRKYRLYIDKITTHIKLTVKYEKEIILLYF